MDFDEIVVKESPGLCRCCLSEGCYKDLSTEYTWMDDTEIYADMLLDCFDISISQHSEGPNGANRLICEVCVTRLRDACNFKKQVLASEKKFVDMIGSGAFKPKAVTYNVPIKSEAILEVQPQETEVEYLEEEMDFADDDVLKDDIIGQTSTEDITVSTLPIKGKKGKPKKTVNKTEKKSCSKIVLVEKPKISKPLTKEIMYLSKLDDRLETRIKKDEMAKLLVIILENSTIMPFRWYSNKYMCFYCCYDFVDSKLLKEHTKEEHADLNSYNVLRSLLKNARVKLDVSEIACKKCPKVIKSFEDFLEHASKAHEIVYDKSVVKHFFCFKLSDDAMGCIECGLQFRFFGPLLTHVHKHHNKIANKFLCEICGQSFIAKVNVQSHMKNVHGSYNGRKCEKCGKTFTSNYALNQHSMKEHKTDRLKCPKCPEVLGSRYLKKRHLALVHDEKSSQFACELCPRVYLAKSALVTHNLRVHVREKTFTCEICGYKSFDKENLQRHMVKHDDSRPFECEFCKKSFQRKKTLEFHRRIHTNDKRYVCSECGKAFVQSTSLKIHLRVHHSIVRDSKK